MTLDLSPFAPATDVMFAGARSGILDTDALAVFDQLGIEQLEQGLDVQLQVLDQWLKAGETLGGWKIGLTSRGGRDSMGEAFRPFGYVLASRQLLSGDSIALADVRHCWLEPEIGVTMGSGLAGEDVSVEQARDAVSSVHAAFEILDRRVPASAKRPVVRLGDGLGQWGTVFGPPHSPDVDLQSLEVELLHDGDITDAGGSGPDVIDDPYLSLTRVCRQLARFGRGLEPGQRLITGSILEPVRVDEPAVWSARFSGLGDVVLRAV